MAILVKTMFEERYKITYSASHAKFSAFIISINPYSDHKGQVQ